MGLIAKQVVCSGWHFTCRIYGKGSDTLQVVQEFAAGFEDFRLSFAVSMSRMGDIGVLTGEKGEIRRSCRFRNADNPSLKDNP
ncbi:putative peroxidase 61 [Nymphaea thermarum]|nr:putative peroxidase 61 [Nymphaea thermarum]